MGAVPFAIVGAGWRAEFFLRVARELAARFRVTGVLTNNPERAARITSAFDVPVRSNLDEILSDRPAFVVVSVPAAIAPGIVEWLANRRVAVLAETPPAEDLAGLRTLADLAASGARVQIAEQYQFQPLHAARLAMVRSRLLGAPTQVQVSVAHDYHGIDLIRRYLGLGFDAVTIVARRFESPIVAGPDRAGPPTEERIDVSEQIVAWLDFDARLGVYDFTMDQYFSWIRSPRLVVRGERGEIHNTTVRWLSNATTPHAAELRRHDTGQNGNLEGLYHTGITLGDEWVYRNPFVPARLTDDEIAVATCLQRMVEYIDGGDGCCSLPEAAWDHELSLAIIEAATTGRPVHVDGSRWGQWSNSANWSMK